jgi:hypothetical protein
MIELLSVISATAAVGIRLALPLLLIALIYGQRAWVSVPLVSQIPTTILLGVLISCSLFEIVGSKRLLSQRVLQILQLGLSPICGAIMGLVVADVNFDAKLNWLMAGVGGLVALVLQLVRAGWFYRLRGLPSWIGFAEDVLCLLLVLAAFRSPQEGGLIALLLLWFAIRSAKEWRDNHLKEQATGGHRSQPD